MPTFPEIPGYKFMKVLGRGGMADVYLAMQKKLNRMVAVKVLIPSVFRDSLFLKRFKREAQTLSKLIHPNIITVYDVGKTGDSYYIVMEYLQESLKERVKMYRRKPDEALLLIRQIAGALFYAHRMGFIHRDIKPDNIMFRKDGTPVVLDFGIARPINASTKLTKTGMSIGTPSYISPEQAKGERVDGRSDIYSLGVVLFELLTGRVPYHAENTLGVILKHIEEPVPKLPSAMKKYQQLINRLMEKDRRKRIRSEESLDRMLRSLLDTRRISVPVPPVSKKNNRREFSDLTLEISSPQGSSKEGKSSQTAPPKFPPPREKKKKTKSGKSRKKFRVIVVFTILLAAFSALLVFRFVFNGSGSMRLNSDQVKAIISENNFFDRIWNKYGHFNNSFNKKSVKGRLVVVDESTDLMWYFSGSRTPMKHERIRSWMEWFNKQKFGGFGDWRLPTLKEAATLLTASNPSDALHVDQLFSRTQKSIWTSNLYGRNGAWVVRFDEGYMLGCPFDLENYIRPVRSLE